MSNIKLLTPNDWEKLRDIRLAALQSDPHAFGGSFAEEMERKEPEWRARLENPDRFFFGIEEGDPDEGADGKGGALVAIAGGIKESEGVWNLVAVHTLPVARGKGYAQALTQAVIDEARKRGAKTLNCYVNVDQKPAVHIYEKAGFVMRELLKDQKMGDGKLHDEYAMGMKFGE